MKKKQEPMVGKADLSPCYVSPHGEEQIIMSLLSPRPHFYPHPHLYCRGPRRHKLLDPRDLLVDVPNGRAHHLPAGKGGSHAEPLDESGTNLEVWKVWWCGGSTTTFDFTWTEPFYSNLVMPTPFTLR